MARSTSTSARIGNWRILAHMASEAAAELGRLRWRGVPPAERTALARAAAQARYARTTDEDRQLIGKRLAAGRRKAAKRRKAAAV